MFLHFNLSFATCCYERRTVLGPGFDPALLLKGRGEIEEGAIDLTGLYGPLKGVKGDFTKFCKIS